MTWFNRYWFYFENLIIQPMSPFWPFTHYFGELPYCSWTKSTTWDVYNSVNNLVNYKPQLVNAGFLPSTVGILIYNLPMTLKLPVKLFDCDPSQGWRCDLRLTPFCHGKCKWPIRQSDTWNVMPLTFAYNRLRRRLRNKHGMTIPRLANFSQRWFFFFARPCFHSSLTRQMLFRRKLTACNGLCYLMLLIILI